MTNYIILEYQVEVDAYNGNVWGPYEYKTQALRDMKYLEKQYADHPAGPFAYKVMPITKAQK